MISSLHKLLREKYKPRNKHPEIKGAYIGPTLRRKVTRGDIERQIRAELAKKSCTLLKINWNKCVAHYVNAHGRKLTHGINFIDSKQTL